MPTNLEFNWRLDFLRFGSGDFHVTDVTDVTDVTIIHRFHPISIGRSIKNVPPPFEGVSMNRRIFMASGLGVVATAATYAVAAPAPASSLPAVPEIAVRRLRADGVNIFYREGGPADGPVLLLLHGFPTSSFQYRELIPRLADRYRVIAPDLPGFGFTDVPAERNYEYTFDALAGTMLGFTDALDLKRYALYVFDYGAPTGLRMAIERPERVTAIVSQNGNAYEEGLGDAWAPIQRYWREPTREHRNVIRAGLNLEGLRHEYSVGIPDPAVIKPEGYTLDA